MQLLKGKIPLACHQVVLKRPDVNKPIVKVEFFNGHVRMASDGSSDKHVIIMASNCTEQGTSWEGRRVREYSYPVAHFLNSHM